MYWFLSIIILILSIFSCPPPVQKNGADGNGGNGNGNGNGDDNDYLNYAYWAGGGWNIETVDNVADDVGEYNFITVDNAGKPYISYYDDTNEYLKLAKWTGQ